MVHLGARVSALLDGRLPAAEAERCWAHVQTCPSCRDLVEREGWLKRQLAGLSSSGTNVSDRLMDQLRATASSAPAPAACAHKPWSRGMVAVGGSALGVAVLGAVALGSGAPISRGPTASLGDTSPAQTSPQPVTDSGRAAPPGSTQAAPPRRRGGAGVTPVAVLSSLTSAEVVELVVTMSMSSRTLPTASTQAGDPVRGTMAP
ncbi:MAG: anti-sigma factor family protein [Nocardioides sp.]|uniref:anti-sigma factor family protein n=1 Tax=Nocardioides sp. TaxID=35761 RepID=UPI003F0B75C2